MNSIQPLRNLGVLSLVKKSSLRTQIHRPTHIEIGNTDTLTREPGMLCQGFLHELIWSRQFLDDHTDGSHGNKIHDRSHQERGLRGHHVKDHSNSHCRPERRVSEFDPIIILEFLVGCFWGPSAVAVMFGDVLDDESAFGYRDLFGA